MSVKGEYADKGSQFQVQKYVNERRTALDDAVLEALPSLAIQRPRLNWVSPLWSQGFKELRDARFLAALGLEKLAPLLSRFWPARGARWDGLAVVERDTREFGVLLVEGKSHVAELKSGGMKATSDPSRQRIDRAMRATADWLTVPEGNRDSWHKSYYQTANRLAHLYWLRELAGVDTWLVHVLFINDPTLEQRLRTSKARWERAVEEMQAELGLDQGFVPHFGHATLRALPKSA
jgi:hypothetical protein